MASVWRSDVRRTGSLHVIPDCCVELVRDSEGVVEVWGPSVAPRQVPLTAGSSYDGVRLRVGAAPMVLGAPADLLAGRVVPASDTRLGALVPRSGPAAWLARVLELADVAGDAW